MRRYDLDGLLVIEYNTTALYLVDQGYKRWIVDPRTRNDVFRAGAPVISFSDLSEIETGDPINPGSGIIGPDDSAAVYFFDNGVKRWVMDVPTLNRYQFRAATRIKHSLIDSLPSGPGILWPESEEDRNRNERLLAAVQEAVSASQRKTQ